MNEIDKMLNLFEQQTDDFDLKAISEEGKKRHK